MRSLTAPSDGVQSDQLTVQELIEQKRLLIVDYGELAIGEPSAEGFYRSAAKENFIFYAPYVLMYRLVFCKCTMGLF